MATGAGEETDLRLGYAIVLGIVVVAGGLAMLLAPGELLAAGGFAIAVLAGLALVVVLHLIG